jgi:hypothetical protein
VWISLSKEWIPAERLPEAALTDVVDYLKTRKPYYTNNSSELTHTSDSTIDQDNTDLGFQIWYKIKPTGRLWNFCENIGRYRREGKNRRDTSTVATRVLRLARHAVSWGDKKPKTKAKL